jgi:hypothetical protein
VTIRHRVDSVDLGSERHGVRQFPKVFADSLRLGCSIPYPCPSYQWKWQRGDRERSESRASRRSHRRNRNKSFGLLAVVCLETSGGCFYRRVWATRLTQLDILFGGRISNHSPRRLCRYGKLVNPSTVRLSYWTKVKRRSASPKPVAEALADSNPVGTRRLLGRRSPQAYFSTGQVERSDFLRHLDVRAGTG